MKCLCPFGRYSSGDAKKTKSDKEAGGVIMPRSILRSAAAAEMRRLSRDYITCRGWRPSALPHVRY